MSDKKREIEKKAEAEWKKIRKKQKTKAAS